MRRSLSLACSSPRVYLLLGKFSAIKAASPDGRSSQAFLLISKAKANYPTCNRCSPSLFSPLWWPSPHPLPKAATPQSRSSAPNSIRRRMAAIPSHTKLEMVLSDQRPENRRRLAKSPDLPPTAASRGRPPKAKPSPSLSSLTRGDSSLK